MVMEKQKFIDIHSHILPGVDDGSRSMEESIAMLKQAQKEGIGTVILTPHQKPERRCVSVDGIQNGIARLREELIRQKIDIELYPGSELFFYHGLRERLASGELCTFAGSRYILVEFFAGENVNYIRSALYELLCDGYFPVVAHVERYEELIADIERIRELIDMGCYIQVNAGSITGTHGLGIKRLTGKLLKEELVHFVATDAHRETGKRSVMLEACSRHLVKKVGQEYADRLLWGNARNILSDEEF